jgi:hypothetical protein
VPQLTEYKKFDMFGFERLTTSESRYLQAAAAGHQYRNQTEPKHMHDGQHPVDVAARRFSVAEHEGPET